MDVWGSRVWGIAGGLLAVAATSLAATSLAAQTPQFLKADPCQLCHRLAPGVPGDRAALGHPVAPYPAWSGSMMAHAARDPYWVAKAKAEKQANPQTPFSVDAVCMRCHAPMQAKTAEGASKPVAVAALDGFGLDGVSCMVCHQILPDGLGTKATFTGLGKYSGELVAFGPHSAPFTMPMLHHTGVTAKEGKHIQESALCGSCHTVITPSLDERGEVHGEFLEQGPYLEWLASSYRQTKSCQGCHVPQAKSPGEGSSADSSRFYIAHNPAGRPFPPTSPREPFGVHSFAGGNAAMLQHLAEQPGAAGSLPHSAARTRENLRRAALLRLHPSGGKDGLAVQVTIRNLTGHKLPTGFPSRRMWVHFTVLDASGKPLFESGALDESGHEIRGQSAASVARVAPHRNRITHPDEVAVYEAEMEDAAGQITHSLLRARRLSKDNRILPAGFDANTPMPAGIPAAWIAPVGASGDADFLAGADTVTYQLPRAVASAAHRVKAELLYQSIKPSHLAALRKAATGEDASDLARLQGALGVEVIASAETALPQRTP